MNYIPPDEVPGLSIPPWSDSNPLMRHCSV